MYMDNIKLFAKTKKELKTLIQTVRMYNQDIGMELGIEKCAMRVMKSGKQHMTEGVKLPNQVIIRMLGEKETYKYLGILEVDTIKQVEMKEKIKKENLRRTRKLLQTKLYCLNLVKGINTWAVLLVRYLGPFLKWTREELKRTRKLMTLHKALYPRDDVDSVKKRGRKRTCQHWRQHWHIDITTGRLHRKAWRKIDYSHQKQYWQQEDQQNGNNQKTKMGRKTTLWMF